MVSTNDPLPEIAVSVAEATKTTSWDETVMEVQVPGARQRHTWPAQDAPTFNTHTHNRFTALWNLSGKTRVSRYQKKHSPTTLIVVINHPYHLSPSSTIHGILPIQSTCSTVFFHNLSPSFLQHSPVKLKHLEKINKFHTLSNLQLINMVTACLNKVWKKFSKSMLKITGHSYL